MQRGRFMLFANRIETNELDIRFETIIDALPKNHSMVSGVLTIPKESKKQIKITSCIKYPNGITWKFNKYN